MKPVNLIPSEHRRNQGSGSRSGSAYVVIGVLGILLLMVVSYVVSTNRVNQAQTDAAAARAEADSLEAEVPKLQTFTNFAEIKTARMTAVSSVAGQRFDWERMMRELSRLMPAGSWLQSMDASVTGDETAAAPAEAAPVQPTLTLIGCTPRQTDTARMMVRLRQMHAALEVELIESSASSDGAGEASATNCEDYTFQLRVTFANPGTVTEAPRGVVRVPASLGGGS